jgi:hypothetical protein
MVDIHRGGPITNPDCGHMHDLSGGTSSMNLQIFDDFLQNMYKYKGNSKI